MNKEMAAIHWNHIRHQAEAIMDTEPSLEPFLRQCVIKHQYFERSLACILSNDIGSPQLDEGQLFTLFTQVFIEKPDIIASVHQDLEAFVDRDPACIDFLTALLYFKGFHALQLYRIAHWLWHQSRHSLALYLQSRSCQEYDVDIHPAARLGAGILIDHATGVVIGETAVVEDDVSILHGVTLGGSGNMTGDRHPKIRRGVLISTGAKILGNIEVGEGAKVAASSLILKSVPPHTTVAGVPAKIVGSPKDDKPSLLMQHELD